jgi:Ca2+-binding EF-hand superfamily protein
MSLYIGAFMKMQRTCARASAAILLIGIIAGASTAVAQKSSSKPSSAKLWLSAMDTDHDGTVSKQEFLIYMDTQFDKADPDHDGTLDRNEVAALRKNLGITGSAASSGKTAPSGQKDASNSSGPKLWLSTMDTDSDGTVSKEEFTVYMDAQFEKADSDHDGTLDQKELAQLQKSLRAVTKP